jgi:lipopolysaccharide export system permease protein
MMKKLDRYILGKFMVTFFFCLLLLTAIIIVIDISEHADDFIKAKLPVNKIITEYYFGFIPRIDAMLFPLFTFISVIFFTSKMAGRSEIVAILSSGVTFRRFLLPYWIGGSFLALMLWGGYQYLVPQANRKWADFEKKYVDVNSAIASYGQSAYRQNVFFRDDPDTYISIRGYDTVSRSGSMLTLNRFRKNELTYNLRAQTFNWDSSEKKWRLFTVVERQFHPVTEAVLSSPDKIAVFNFHPEALRKDDYLKDQMTTPELNRFIRLEKKRGSEILSTLQVERHNRDAIPASVLILSLIGAILSSRKLRGGSGMHLALGVVISMVYVLAGRFTSVFATKGNLTPWLAAWLPNILFILLAVYLYRKAPK